jgi:TonB family protein
VDDGPAATVADQPGRVRDNRDAELLAARMVQSFVEATQADGRAEGRGTGGSGHGGKPGSGGTSGAGGRSTSHQPGPGRYPALDTGDHRYRTWYNSQRRRIERALVFPRERQLAMDQGTAVYRLTVRRNGTLADAPRLLRRSGHADLDRAALAAIRESVPFDPIPPDLAPSYEAIRVTLALQFSNPMVR